MVPMKFQMPKALHGKPALWMVAALAAGLLPGCAGLGNDFGEGESGVDSSGIPRRPSLPSYTSRGILRQQLEPVEFGDTAWEIPDSEKPKIKAAAKALRTQEQRVILAGGAVVTSPEYARQLGQQRAEAVRQALVLEGIPASRIITVSYGGDLPGGSGDRVEFGLVPTGETSADTPAAR